MPAIDLHLSKNLFTPKALPLITDFSHRWELWYGGSGSSKSYSITQKLIIRACNEKIRILVCRRYATTLRNTVFALFKEILTKWKIINYVKIRESDFRITFPNQSEIIFVGLDDETKLLSLTNIGTVWVEEAFEVPKDIVEQLNLRMRGQNKNQQIIMSWNPISKDHWLYDFTEVSPPANSISIHLTFKDNPFISQEYKDAMEDLLVRNPRKAEVYYYGKWQLPYEGLVYTNWREEPFSEMELAQKGLEHRVGIDLGFIDPTTVVETLYDKANKTIYVFREFYKSGIQLDALAAYLDQQKLRKTELWIDAAEPRSIEFLRLKGFNAKPCLKGQDSVKARITFLQNHTIIVSPKCENVIRELSNFSYVKDRDGKYTEKTTHEFSHTLDALGYAYSTIYKNNRLTTIDKSALGL